MATTIDHSTSPAAAAVARPELSDLAPFLERYDRPGPRYTSYPTALQFRDDFDSAQWERHARQNAESASSRPLSLYVHIPFCVSPCFYCGCNRVITRDFGRGERYVESLALEAARVAPIVGPRRRVAQLHLGGGTPNFLSADSMARLLSALNEHFDFGADPLRDFSIELDPRTIAEPLDSFATGLAKLGFNRVSLGVQDFDPHVQQAVNRIQSRESTLALVDACRDAGIRSVNLDLIYGLPRQTAAGFLRTLRTVISARPDRLAVYGYAHLPAHFKAQRRIHAEDLPDPRRRLELLALAIQELTEHGYRHIGMDHFALPDDVLSRAQDARTLQRNFMGYTTHAGHDLLALGVSAISHVGSSYTQNYRTLMEWQRAIDAGALPLWRGLTLSPDDITRAMVIEQLMCHGLIDMAAVESARGIDFSQYFGDALKALEPLSADGLVELTPQHLTVTERGRLLLRNIAMCFDRYLPQAQTAGAPIMARAI